MNGEAEWEEGVKKAPRGRMFACVPPGRETHTGLTEGVWRDAREEKWSI